jgi:hypothetical protein
VWTVAAQCGGTDDQISELYLADRDVLVPNCDGCDGNVILPKTIGNAIPVFIFMDIPFSSDN